MNAPIRPARRGTLLLFVIVHAVLITVVNLWLFASGAFHPLAQMTGGLVNGTLIVNLVLAAILVWGVCLKLGFLRAYDVGWIPHQLGIGLMTTLALWTVAQLIHLAAGAASNGSVALSPAFAAGQSGVAIGALIGQIFGNALFEELAYRGFLFPQLYLRLHGSGERPWLRFVLTLLISQAIFALVHIPNRLYMGLSAGEIAADLALLTLWGVLFTLLYLHTDNLFIVVGVHALGNAPTTLFATAPALAGSGSSLLIYGLAVLGVFAVPALLRWWRLRVLVEPLPPEAWASEN
ncbi:MAG: CPBP family intramembrane metalloprotease [Anaerolineae bacterium]|nr:CPBP family intramembrane metalloprotease [Anaerolineae bacterium]